MTAYADFKPLTFHDAAVRFSGGGDSPRAYLERCLETISRREPVVKALTAMNEAGARAAAGLVGLSAELTPGARADFCVLRFKPGADLPDIEAYLNGTRTA